MILRHLLVLTATLSMLSACGSPKPPRVPVAVLVRGGERDARAIHGALAHAPPRGVEIRFVDLPAVPESPRSETDVEAHLAAARRAYTLPDVPRCLAELGEDELVADLLADGRRPAAARVLFWRVACLVAGASLPEAERVAAALAAYGLEVPADVDAASPEAEAVLGRAIAAVAAQPPAHLRITSSVAGATVALDGRESPCITPCRLDARPGQHVVLVKLDGYSPQRRTLIAREGDTVLDVTLTEASPEVAAQQWSARFGATGELDSEESLRLLTHAVRARSLALITASGVAPELRLRGVLAVDGAPRARAEHLGRATDELGRAAPPLLDDLMQVGKLVDARPITKRPLFWIAVAVAAVGAAAATYGLARPRDVVTQVHF